MYFKFDYLFTDELPNSFDPAGGHVIRVAIDSGIADLEPNSAQIFFADGNGGIDIYPLNNEGMGVHSFEVPPVDCGNNTTFWFTAETTEGVLVFYPDDAPEERFNVVSANDFVNYLGYEIDINSLWRVFVDLTISQIAPILPYLLLVLMLIARPRGLFGTRDI